MMMMMMKYEMFLAFNAQPAHSGDVATVGAGNVAGAWRC